MKLNPLSVLGVLREVRRGAGDPRPLAVAGARELVPLLAKELRAGGDPAAVVEQRVEDSAALVWIGAPDEAQLRVASRAHVPIVALTDAADVPYVLPANVLRAPAGRGFPVAEIATALARSLGEDGTSLAARLPVLRPAVCKQLIAQFSKRNAIAAAAIFVPGVDMPILTMNEIRLVLRIALAYGQEIDRERAVEIAGVVGAGFGLRAVAGELLDAVPVAGWAVKGAVAYSGTRAIGEAAVRYFDARA